MKTSNEIREAFLQFFEEQQHERVASAPLPQKDNPTLLFTNAGMNQFTNLFLGVESRPYSRASTSQKCMRVSGKHNDLTNVGPSPRHHTFFEMLGNFSFGNYFKKEAIEYAWTFLTQVLALDKQRLWVSIYQDDDEAFELWQAHVPAERILRFDEKENFWEMGDVGPCGPCSEIHYYTGDLAEQRAEGVNVDDAYLEIWNLVFMQYEKDADGNMTPLPRPSIDTGMGLERITFALQGGESNYDTDLFQPAMNRVQELLEDSEAERQEHEVGYRVIADHVRAATFLIADGVRPGADGADYVLRMIIRRAARFGRDIGFSEPFMAEVAQVYIEQMAEAYPELRQQAENIKYTLTQEEERFASTLDKALIYFERLVHRMQEAGETVISGDEAFDLYATHGLPLEITQDLAEQVNLRVDEAGYKAAREEHAQRSGSGAFKAYETAGNVYTAVLNDLIAEGKLGQEGVKQEQYGAPRLESKIVGLLRDGERLDTAKKGQKVEIITAVTPFYVESGGQVSDIGTITIPATGAQVRIEAVYKPLPNLIVHSGELLQGEIKLGSNVILRVDDERRANIRRHHTATHILHEELRRHLGKHVAQAGSLVAPDRLRFDFTHDKRVTDEELAEIEEAVNQAIAANLPVSIAFMGQKEAIGQGAMALFGEKYGDIVRTVKIGQEASQPYSFELCGGLHVSETNDIQLFQFTGESAVSAGVRRVEAVTGQQARQFLTERLNLLNRVAQMLGVPAPEVEKRLESLLADNKALQKEIDQLKKASLLDEVDELFAQVQQVEGVNLLTAVVENADADGLRSMLDKYRDKMGSGVGVLGTANNGRPLVIAMVTDDLVQRGVHAGNLVREVAKLMGGGGGGRPNLAQAGGKDVNRLPDALTAVVGLLKEQLKN